MCFMAAPPHRAGLHLSRRMMPTPAPRSRDDREHAPQGNCRGATVGTVKAERIAVATVPTPVRKRAGDSSDRHRYVGNAFTKSGNRSQLARSLHAGGRARRAAPRRGGGPPAHRPGAAHHPEDGALDLPGRGRLDPSSTPSTASFGGRRAVLAIVATSPTESASTCVHSPSARAR